MQKKQVGIRWLNHMGVRVNIGCGRTPTKGWRNYDNSWTLRLSKVAIVVWFARKFGLLSKLQEEFIVFLQQADIKYADATNRIPEHSGSVDVLYTSHMLEHLDRMDAMKFLAEAKRVIRKGGILRIAVPNIRYYVDMYMKDGDADRFVEGTLLVAPKPRGLWRKLIHLLVSDRNHKWMYDGQSLCRLLVSAGFHNPVILQPGETTINEAGNIDLAERVPESVFVEVVRT